VIDLMDALRASLEKSEAARTATTQMGTRKAPKRVEQQSPKAAGKASRR